MSDENEKNANPFADSMNTFRGMYEQMMKQTEKQWEEVARNPLFIAQMANNFEQSMQMQKQMREVLETSLKTLNLPSKEDLLLLTERIDSLQEELAEANAKLDLLTEKSKKTKSKKV